MITLTATRKEDEEMKEVKMTQSASNDSKKMDEELVERRSFLIRGGREGKDVYFRRWRFFCTYRKHFILSLWFHVNSYQATPKYTPMRYAVHLSPAGWGREGGEQPFGWPTNYLDRQKEPDLMDEILVSYGLSFQSSVYSGSLLVPQSNSAVTSTLTVHCGC